MSSRSNQLESIQQLASIKEEHAAKSLAVILERKLQAEQQLVDLINYRQDYESKMKLSHADGGVPIEQIRQGRLFNERLGEAIRQQQSLISSLVKEIERQVEHWRSSHASNKLIESLLQRYRLDDRRRRDRRMEAESQDNVYNRFFLERNS